MAKFNNNALSADPEISANRKIRVLGIDIQDDNLKIVIRYHVYYKSAGSADLKVNAHYPPASYSFDNNKRVTSTGQQFTGNTYNAPFSVFVPYPFDPTDPLAADTIAFAAATPEYDFIKNKMETNNGAGAIDLLAYTIQRLLLLDSQGFFNT